MNNHRARARKGTGGFTRKWRWGGEEADASFEWMGVDRREGNGHREGWCEWKF